MLVAFSRPISVTPPFSMTTVFFIQCLRICQCVAPTPPSTQSTTVMKECRWLATRICVACNNSWPRNRPVLCHVIWMRWEPWDLEWPWQSMISWRNCCTKCNLRSVAQKIVDQKEAQMITFETTSKRKHETGETTVLFESFRWLAASLFVWVAALCRASPSTKRCAATCHFYGACNLTSSQWKSEEA